MRAGVVPLTIASDDGVRYAALIGAMDVALAAGYTALDVTGTQH